MADATYLPRTYRKAGGNTIVVSSGGELVIESGGTLTLESGSILSATGAAAELKVAAGALTAHGISCIGSASAGARTYTLAKPASAGLRKTIICRSSTGACLVRCSSLATLNYSTNRKITFAANADGYSVELVATTSTNWQTIRNSTAQVTTIVYGAT
jgi:hypothetical protein